MISPSRRRRRSAQPADTEFQTHLRLAQRKNLHRRLIRASLLALAVAAALLFAPVSGTWHAILTALAFAVGAALPLRGSEEAALEEIRAHAGFSYDTALGLLAATESGAGSDPYGFAAAVTQRARLAMRGFRPTPQAAWWLPATLVALTLVLLPSLLPSLGALGAGGGPGGGGSGAAAPGFEESLESQEEEQDDSAEPQPEAPGRVNDGTDGSGTESIPDDAVVPPPPEDGAGQAPLARYLESLRERPASRGGATTQGAAQEAQDAPGEADVARERAAGSQTATRPPQDATTASDESGRQDASGEASPDGPRGGTTRAQDDQDGASSQEGADETGQDAGASEQSGAQQSDDQRLSEEDGAAQGTGAESGGGERDAGTERGSGASSDLPGSGDGEGDAGQGGAEASGEPTTVDLGIGSPELLSGVLGDGPESTAGTVRLPGSDEVQLPSGTSTAPYRSAAEEALTEGDLPLDYQEIIRRYFR